MQRSHKAPTRKRNKRLILLIALSVIVVLSVAGGAVYYQANRPQKIFAAAVTKIIEQAFGQNSSRLSGSYSVSGSSTSFKYTFDTTTSKGFLVSGDKKSAISFQPVFENTAPILNGELLTQKGQSTVYIKPTNLKAGLASFGSTSDSTFMAGLTMLQPVLSKADNAWISVTPEDLQQVDSNTSGELETILGCFNKVKAVKLTQNQINKLSHDLQHQSAIRVSDSLPSATIDGHRNSHYKLAINSQKHPEIQSLLDQIPGFNDLYRCTSLKTLKLSSDNVSGEIWVDTHAKLLSQLVLRQTQDGATSALTLTFHQGMQSLNITKPTISISFTELKKMVEAIYGADFIQYIKTGVFTQK